MMIPSDEGRWGRTVDGACWHSILRAGSRPGTMNFLSGLLDRGRDLQVGCLLQYWRMNTVSYDWSDGDDSV